MKIKTIFLTIILLIGCRPIQYQSQPAEKHSPEVSTKKNEEVNSNLNKLLSVKKSNVDSPNEPKTQNLKQKNLWDFIRSQIKEPVQNHPLISKQKEKYLKSKKHFYDMAFHAEPYMYLIAEEIQKRHMPIELILLPIVESNFNPAATSSANAAGLWQMLPSTAKYYGVKQNKWYDGRYDVLASTNAALNLMQNLNRKFNGDWLLTIAAYNCGEFCVLREIKANKKRGKPTDFWSLSLPKETYLYIPKMLALSDIIKNSEKYSIQLPDSDEDRRLVEVNVGHPIKLAQVAVMSGLPLSQLKLYNSGYKRKSTPPGGPYYFMMPQSHFRQFKMALKRKKKSMTEVTLLARNQNHKMFSTFYTVRAGDTLSSIARRTKIKMSDLENWNQLKDPHLLKMGQVLQLKNEVNHLKDLAITDKVRSGN